MLMKNKKLRNEHLLVQKDCNGAAVSPLGLEIIVDDDYRLAYRIFLCDASNYSGVVNILIMYAYIEGVKRVICES